MYLVENTGDAVHTIRPKDGEPLSLQHGERFTGRFTETELRSMRNSTGLRVTHLAPAAEKALGEGAESPRPRPRKAKASRKRSVKKPSTEAAAERPPAEPAPPASPELGGPDGES